jgi:hypothetical protein
MKLTDTFSVNFSPPCKGFKNKHTQFNSELHFSINDDRLSTHLTKTDYECDLLQRQDQISANDSFRYRHLQQQSLRSVVSDVRCCPVSPIFERSVLIFLLLNTCESRNSDWLRAGLPRGRSWSPGSCKIFRTSPASRPVRGPPSFLSNGNRRLFPRAVKRPGHEADQSQPVPKSRIR